MYASERLPHDGGCRAVSPPTGRTSPVSNVSDRTTPTGRRSPKSYYERTTTVRFVQPSTGRAVCTKLNRVQRTKARIDNGTCLCENFLRGHCDFGSNCPLAHVPKQYLWEFLTPTVNRDTYTYDKGFNVRCYTPNMDAYYDIPSEWIYVTRGSERYVELYNDNGDNFKEKCKLCEDLQRTGCCQRGGECEDVHCCCADISQFPCIRTHIAEPEAVRRYERLDHSVTVRVFQPNSGVDSQDFAGDDVLRTAGATQYEEAYMREGGTVPNVKMQHCAHFQNKKLCRLGDGCRFLHVVSVALATPMMLDDDDVTPRLSPVMTARAPPSPPLPPAAQVSPRSRASKNSAAYFAAASLAQGGGGYAGGGGRGGGGGSSIDNSIVSSFGASNYSGYDESRQLPCVLNVTSAPLAHAAPSPSLTASAMAASTTATTTTAATTAMAAGVAPTSTHIVSSPLSSSPTSPTATATRAAAACARVTANNNNNSNNSSTVGRNNITSILPGARFSPNSTALRVPLSDPAVLAMAEVIQLPEACAREATKAGTVVSPRRNNPYALSPPTR